MRKQDQLLELIQSLSANEKRHFKLLSTINAGDKSYVALFDVLNELPYYDVSEVSRQLKKTKTAIAHSKEHLKDMLLRSLRLFNEDSFSTAYYNRSIEEVELLHSKGQYVWAFSKVEKLLVEAQKEEVFPHVLILFRWYHTLAYYVGRGTFNAKQCLVEKKVILAYENEIAYQHLLYKFNYLLNEGREMMRGKAGKELSDLINSELLVNKKKAISQSAQIIFHRIHALYGLYITREFETTQKHFKAAISVFKKNPDLLRAKSRVYCLLSSGLFGMQNSHGKYLQAAKTLSDLEATLLHEKRFSKASIHYGYTLLFLGQLYNYAYSGSYAEAVKYSENIQQKHRGTLKQSGDSFRFDFYFVTALSYWKTENYKSALKHSQRLMANETTSANVSVLINRFLFVLIQYDLGHYTLLPYLIKSNQRWFLSHNNEDAAVDVFNKMMIEVSKVGANKKMASTVFNKYKAQFVETQSIVFETLGLLEWLDIKTTRYRT